MSLAFAVFDEKPRLRALLELRRPGVATIIKVQSRADLSGRCRFETRYYISSALTARQAAEACWTWSFAKTNPVSEKATARRPSSDISPSTSSDPQRTNEASSCAESFAEKSPDGTQITSPTCSTPQAVNLDSLPCRSFGIAPTATSGNVQRIRFTDSTGMSRSAVDHPAADSERA
jgi:hypothetical protein